jgi:hypothetical protein
MKRTLIACALGSLLLGGPAAAEQEVRELPPVQVSALRNPELHKYKAIVAGLDSFDRHHALAPKVPELRFRIETRGGAPLPEQPKVKIEGERDFVLPLALDAGNRFSVPRSAAALDADGELVLNQKRRSYRIVPEVRTPGLPDGARRLGDLRLECKVMFDIAKEEMPLYLTLMVNGLLMTRDWCSFFAQKNYAATLSFKSGAPIVGAILTEGNRSKALETTGDEFRVGLGDADWGDEALVELRFAEPGATVGTASAAPALTGTAAGTPRTAP